MELLEKIVNAFTSHLICTLAKMLINSEEELIRIHETLWFLCQMYINQSRDK